MTRKRFYVACRPTGRADLNLFAFCWGNNMARLAQAAPATSKAPFSHIRLIHARTDQVESMTFEEFQQRWRQMRKNNENPALRYFNRQSDDFKFCVLTLANREQPAAFKQDEIGKPFEYFDKYHRELIIKAMNKMSRWGELLPRRFSISDCFLSE
ncbi:hypothetical protein N5923_17665 [Erwiniaceae bacterium BAC15a-03b]|uniref:Uncharacterized protein n=3 Tax=Erwiniaceae TaxID=1903409 RepID=A0A9J6PSD3_9GAMM|nr:hypothetical protein [Winslowiella arboricola]MCU5779315.1 hypothetical protein [Winslowiella arboricola]